MNVDLQDLLTGQADSVDPPHVDPYAVVTRGEQLVRRRRTQVVAASAMVLALTAGVTALVLDRTSARLSPTPSTPGDVGVVRALTYGQKQVLHLGDREFDTGLDFLSLDVTDEGAALTTVDGGIWFTDGTEVEQVGATIGGYVMRGGVGWMSQRPQDWVVGDSSGSLLAWLEYPNGPKGEVELVVYDTGLDAVARHPLGWQKQDGSVVVAVAGRDVFVSPAPVGGPTGSPFRYNLDSGALELVEEADVEAAMRAVPRALVVDSPGGKGEVMTYRWQPGHFEDVLTLEELESGLSDPHTGRSVRLEVPDLGVDPSLVFVQWLDDDRFALISNGLSQDGDLLVCTLSAGRCEVEIEQSHWEVDPLLPGDGGVGAERALLRVMEKARQ